jgi:hypothetical protein
MKITGEELSQGRAIQIPHALQRSGSPSHLLV